MEQPEYMRMKINNLPPNFVKSYNLNDLATNNGTIYVKIQKGMCGLPQAASLHSNFSKNDSTNMATNKATSQTGVHPVWYSILWYCCKNYFSNVQHRYMTFSLTITYFRARHKYTKKTQLSPHG
jgi:hypothetical protein